MCQAHSGIGARIARRTTRPNHWHTATVMKCVIKRCGCISMALIYAGSGGSLVSIIRVLPTGSKPMLTAYRLHPFPTELKRLNWTNCTPSSSTKKRNLHHNLHRPPHPLHCRLGGEL